MQASPFLTQSFYLLAAAVAVVLLAAVWVAWRTRGEQSALRITLISAALLGGWIAFTGALAAQGLLHFDSFPPPLLPLFVAILATSLGVAFSPFGRQLAKTLPYWALIGIQSFRLPLELLMHRAKEEGLMPVQMSYSGLNFDIVTGITAILVAILVARDIAPATRRRLVLAWNVLGSVLLVAIIVISWLSAPTPLRVFHDEPANVWITRLPFVWLPTLFVWTALAGHAVIWRKLAAERD